MEHLGMAPAHVEQQKYTSFWLQELVDQNLSLRRSIAQLLGESQTQQIHGLGHLNMDKKRGGVVWKMFTRKDVGVLFLLYFPGIFNLT